MAYKAKDFCILTPRTVDLDGTRVAIGGKVTITPEPPSLPKLIHEATQDQYRRLHDMGFTSLIDFVEEIEAKEPKKRKDIDV